MKLLVAIDLASSSEKLLNEARKIAKALSAQVWLLHVAPPDPDFIGYEVGPQSVRDAIAKAFHEEHTELQEIADAWRDDGMEVTALLLQGITPEVILKEAEQLEIEQIIMGSHGHGAMYQLLVGSVSEEVIRHAICPVTIVPTHER